MSYRSEYRITGYEQGVWTVGFVFFILGALGALIHLTGWMIFISGNGWGLLLIGLGLLVAICGPLSLS